MHDNVAQHLEWLGRPLRGRIGELPILSTAAVGSKQPLGRAHSKKLQLQLRWWLGWAGRGLRYAPLLPSISYALFLEIAQLGVEIIESEYDDRRAARAATVQNIVTETVEPQLD